MLRLKITNFNSFANTGEDGEDSHENCRNTINYDSGCLLVDSYKGEKGEKDICYILFDLNPEFIKELKTFVNVLEAHYEELD